MTVTGILVLVLLLFPSAAAAFGSSFAPSLLMGIDIAQEKHLATVNVDDAIRIADYYAGIGDYERAINIYDLAEMQWSRDNPDRSSDYFFRLATMENKKGVTYRQWGKYTEAEAAERTADRMFDRGYSKQHEEEEASGCLIVTATFGSPLTAEVQLVRNYRDETIRKSYAGSQFVTGFNAWYYSFSPAVSGYIATHPLVRSVMQACLVPLLWIILLSQNLHAALGFSPELATVSVLLLGAALYSLVYILPAALLGAWLAGRRGWKAPAPERMRPVLGVWAILLVGLSAGVLLSLDTLTAVASVFLVACTVVLVAGTGALSVVQYLGRRSGISPD
jgi:tetratricopeptide (TPR) repeat protein